jgi:hypothetical protein
MNGKLRHSIAKFSHDREWALNYPSEGMREFCGTLKKV